MKKQTKLVAVLSTAALRAIGASMTSVAATGWAEEDGTWVYYDRNGDKVTDKWAKSGNNWYYLDSDGEMAVDSLIEDGDNYYYVDVDGVMAANQWVAIDNEDAGQDDEPEHYWYYFQANGKALKQGDGSTLSLKTVNGKKYAFDDEGKMLYGWVAENSAERIDDTDSDAFKEGDYYFGGEDDGAMTTGWLLMDITYDEATSDYEIAPAFNEDEDQSRWFYFKSNGKKVKAESGDVQKSKTINGKKYEFDENGAMTAEWSLDVKKASDAGAREEHSTSTKSSTARYSQMWRYFNSVEDGSRVSKGWFKVVASEYLNYDKYNDDEDGWYYADGSGNLYAGEFKTIKGKKYAFRNDGRMVDGLKFIKKESGSLKVVADNDDRAGYNFDTEDDFIDHAIATFIPGGYDCYYFGGSEDGAMKTNKANITIDGDSFNFYFEKSGANKGAGVTGEKDDKYYLAGMLVKAGSDEKYQVVEKSTVNGKTVCKKLADAAAFKAAIGAANTTDALAGKSGSDKITIGDVTKKAEDLKEAYTVTTPTDSYFLVNTSGTVVDKKSKSKDGDDYVFVTDRNGKIVGVYVED